jgi:hypothetical protein
MTLGSPGATSRSRQDLQPDRAIAQERTAASSSPDRENDKALDPMVADAAV